MEISQPKPAVKTDPINELKPGDTITVEGKEAMAKANIAETENAHKMAAEQRGRDAQNEPPLERALADSIKDKLEALPPEKETQK